MTDTGSHRRSIARFIGGLSIARRRTVRRHEIDTLPCARRLIKKEEASWEKLSAAYCPFSRRPSPGTVGRDPAELADPLGRADRLRPVHPGLDLHVVHHHQDSPLRSAAASNKLYIELLAQATRYAALFFTPYLMPGDALLDAMARAAHRGVDIRIIMPGMPDKKLVFRMSHSFYPVLLGAGSRSTSIPPASSTPKSASSMTWWARWAP